MTGRFSVVCLLAIMQGERSSGAGEQGVLPAAKARGSALKP